MGLALDIDLLRTKWLPKVGNSTVLAGKHDLLELETIFNPSQISEDMKGNSQDHDRALAR